MWTQAKRNDSSAYGRTVHASISFPEEQHQVLERIAVENKVSLVWVVRDAINDYLKSRWSFSRKQPMPKMRSIEARNREQYF